MVCILFFKSANFYALILSPTRNSRLEKAAQDHSFRLTGRNREALIKRKLEGIEKWAAVQSLKKKYKLVDRNSFIVQCFLASL